MPKFKITHYKDVTYKAEYIVEAKDRNAADVMAHGLPRDKWNDLHWVNAENEERKLGVLYAEEITGDSQ
jgi:hypothetical protein